MRLINIDNDSRVIANKIIIPAKPNFNSFLQFGALCNKKDDAVEKK